MNQEVETIQPDNSGKKFKRTVEDFSCEQCGREVVGNGYTNHCPGCLWSKHVDINPGDRAEKCCGMMRPVGIEALNGEQVVNHRCVICKHQRKNKVSGDDDHDSVLELFAGN